jgi:hypothetical protein
MLIEARTCDVDPNSGTTTSGSTTIEENTRERRLDGGSGAGSDGTNAEIVYPVASALNSGGRGQPEDVFTGTHSRRILLACEEKKYTSTDVSGPCCRNCKICLEGTVLEPCKLDSDTVCNSPAEKCTPCGSGQKYTGCTTCADCDAGRYQTSTSHSDTSCTVWSTCGAGQKQSVAPLLTRNRACVDCDAGRYQTSTSHSSTLCAVWSTCGAGQKQSVAPLLTRNRACVGCDTGKFQISTPFTGNSCVSDSCLLVFVFHLGFDIRYSHCFFLLVLVCHTWHNVIARNPLFIFWMYRNSVRPDWRLIPSRLCAQHALVENTKIETQ